VASFNPSRKNILLLTFIALFVIMVAQLVNLQLFSNKYRLAADDQGLARKVIYPDRGIIYDRHKKVLVQNATTYDLMVIPSKVKGTDTFRLCSILGIDTTEFKKRILAAINKNTWQRPSAFQVLLGAEQMAKIKEAASNFEPGFYLQQRSVRTYPYDVAGNIIGYLSEVDSATLKNPKYVGYNMGDYIGKTGLEKQYEKVLMGQRGIEFWKKDKLNRLTERWENGKYDTTPVAGQNMYTSIDIKLQELGEKLMQNKLGSIVALNPKTGSVICMVSAPNYKPTSLTGTNRKKEINRLIIDPSSPLQNRTVAGEYSPGSTFKTLQALVGMNEGVITTTTPFSCSGAFYGCGGGNPMGCLDYGTYILRNAITVSDNTYFANVMQRVINNPKYPNLDSSLRAWDNYMYAFGLGKRLGVDIPNERPGLIPTPEFYDKRLGKGRWNFCSFRSNAIGQGEVLSTPIQVANEMCFLANKGWFYTPHIIDSIEGGDTYGMLEKYKIKHNALNIADSVYEAVHDGMEGVITGGTGKNARVKDIRICGKTGTVENYYRGAKQPNHGFFCAFAPREDPKIAIMCVVENGGRFGGSYAAPIVGYLIEQYLKDSITDKGRLAGIEKMANTNLIPKRIYAEMRRQDSILHAGDSAYLIMKGFIKIIKDSLELDDDDVDDLLEGKEKIALKDDKDKKKKGEDPTPEVPVGNLNTDDKRKNKVTDTLKN
jgi:penicillin-binding protein 2